MKLLFVAIPLLVVGTVFWHLQYPFGTFQDTDETNCEKESCERKQSAPHRASLGTLITDIRLFQFDGVRNQWTLRGSSAQHEGEERIIIHKPNLTIYKKNGQMASVTSAEGVIDNLSQTMIFTGEVVAVNGTQRLSTDILRFDTYKRILYTDQRFLLVDGRMRLEGIGLTLYQKTKKLVVSHRVKVQMLSQTIPPRDTHIDTKRAGAPHYSTMYEHSKKDIPTMTHVRDLVLPC